MLCSNTACTVPLCWPDFLSLLLCCPRPHVIVISSAHFRTDADKHTHSYELTVLLTQQQVNADFQVWYVNTTNLV